MVVGSPFTVPPMDHFQWARKLRVRLEKYACIFGCDLFLVATVKLLWVHGHNKVPGNLHYFSATMLVLADYFISGLPNGGIV